jgi:predicted transcriptional regulator
VSLARVDRGCLPRALVFVVEGEKDVETLRKHGVPATTNPMGATTVEKQEKGSGWLDCYTETLRGADVVICGDNDAPGREHVRIVARKLHGVVGRLRILDLKQFWPEIEESEDISDWFAAGGIVERLWQIVEELPDYVPAGGNGHDEAAPPWEGDDFGPQPSAQGVEQSAGNNSKALSMEALKTMTFNPIKYVVPGIIVEGLTLLAGKPKIGKSWLLLHAGVAVARAGFTLGDIHCIEGDVLYCALEDNLRRLQSRMTKLFGIVQDWPEHMHVCCELPRLSQGGLAFIRDWIEEAPHPRLVIIDTLAMVRPPSKGKDQTQYDADYTAVLELRAMAAKYGIAIVLVHHLRKADADDAFDTISGTLGLSGAVDTVLVLKRDGSGNIVLHGRGRDLVEIEKAITFDQDSCLWTIAGDADAVRRSSERQTVLQAIAEAGEPVGPQDIADATGMRAQNVRFLLRKLLAERAIEKALWQVSIGTQNDQGRISVSTVSDHLNINHSHCSHSRSHFDKCLIRNIFSPSTSVSIPNLPPLTLLTLKRASERRGEVFRKERQQLVEV